MCTNWIWKGEQVEYIISRTTKALMVERNGIYRTKVLDGEQIIYLKESLLRVINRNCTMNGAALTGRIETVGHVLDSNSKLPMPVAPSKGFYLFPTTSIRNPNCVVLSYNQISLPVIPQEDGILIRFNDNTVLDVKVSLRQFQNQYQRTGHVIRFYRKLKG